jgi:hypothetical protein
VVLDFEPLVKKTFRNDTDHVDIAGGELDVRWRTSESATFFFRAHHLEWLDERTDQSATVGVQEQNPATSLWIGGDGTWKDFEGHLELGYVAPRSYAAQACRPASSSWTSRLTPIDAAVHWQVFDDKPLLALPRRLASAGHERISSPQRRPTGRSSLELRRRTSAASLRPAILAGGDAPLRGCPHGRA